MFTFVEIYWNQSLCSNLMINSNIFSNTIICLQFTNEFTTICNVFTIRLYRVTSEWCPLRRGTQWACIRVMHNTCMSDHVQQIIRLLLLIYGDLQYVMIRSHLSSIRNYIYNKIRSNGNEYCLYIHFNGTL